MTATAPGTRPADLAGFTREWEAWHRAHEARRADPLGFLAITALLWLDTAPARAAGAPGAWRTGPEGPSVELAEGETLELDGAAIRGRHAFGPLAERTGLTLRFTDGGVAGAVELARRGGHDIVRPRRADHPFLSTYAGTPAYAPDPRWRVPARFTAFAEPRPTEVGSVVDGLRHVTDAVGEVSFSVAGESARLTVFGGRAPGTLSAHIADATSGRATVGTGRTVALPAPDADGLTVLDLTRATNLPCAYTDFATCPLPPAGNRLPFAVEAGERIPLDRVRADAPVTVPA